LTNNINTMLSINIPVYNIKISDLVMQLKEQADKPGVDYEIRIYDDGSTDAVKENNRIIRSLPNVTYLEMDNNLGRSAIRNKMGLESKYPWLLFIDADSRIISENYLRNYLKKTIPACVLCGGTCYNPQKPENPNKLLRWLYGTKREAVSAEERKNQKGFIITSNNFLIDKEIFKIIHFSENIGPYGHEDTLLGYELYSSGFTPLHIDNPVEHTGLEDSATFLEKTRDALDNLWFIYREITGEESDFSRQVSFLKRYNEITLLIPPFLLRFFFRLFRGCIEKNLTGRKPSLLLFDTYRLCYFSTLKITAL
jgi:glycosyltransferase involved in cell wall biosynthesis